MNSPTLSIVATNAGVIPGTAGRPSKLKAAMKFGGKVVQASVQFWT